MVQIRTNYTLLTLPFGNLHQAQHLHSPNTGIQTNAMAEIAYAHFVLEGSTHTALHPQTIFLSSYRRTR